MGDKIVYKGSLFALNRLLFLAFFSLGLTIYLIWTPFSSELAFDSIKYRELVFSTIGCIAATLIFYGLLTLGYYYYEIGNDRIIVKNLIRPYYKELPFEGLQNINISGNLTTSKLRPNSLEFIYQPNDSSQNFKYSSLNFERDEWISLIKELKKRNLRLVDPNHEFFRDSE
jgi:hypothetical protein